MAERRMFAKTIIDSDAFLDMPLSTQALYFHLSMRADDDGFLNNPQKIARMVGCNKNELDLLIAKKFIIVFENGIIVIKHWKIHNYIRKDRYNETVYQEEKSMLIEKENGSYSLNEMVGIPPVNQSDTQRLTQVRLGKDSIELSKDSINNIQDDKSSPCLEDAKDNKSKTEKKKEVKSKFGEFEHVLLTDSEMNRLIDELGEEMYSACIKKLDEYIEYSGKKYKNHNLVIRNWVVKAVTEDKQKAGNSANGTNESKNYNDTVNRMINEIMEEELSSNGSNEIQELLDFN